MESPRFILSKKKLLEQLEILKKLKLRISYSYKTNNIVGNLLQELDREIEFSVHSIEEAEKIKDKSRIWFFMQAENPLELKRIFEKGIKKIVVDNEMDLMNLTDALEKFNENAELFLRMKTYEHRIGSGKYFVYGMPSAKINSIVQSLSKNPFISRIGVHIHRKSQNISEWDIEKEIKDSLSENTLKSIDFINLGGGIPIEYKSFSGRNLGYVFEKIKEARDFLNKRNIVTCIEPGRFLAGPCIKLETKIIQIYDNNIIINATIFNCALDNLLTNTRLLVEGELDEADNGKVYLIKGNSPARDDIFRHRVKLKNPKIGDKIVFLNAGAYNYTTDFFGFKKIPTIIID